MGKYFKRPILDGYETEEEYYAAIEAMEDAESLYEDSYREREIIQQLESDEQSGLV